jgi:multiple sugar transport system ATP-binding protein
MTVRKNIGFPLRMAKLEKAEIDKRVNAAASVLNLTDYLERRPGQLSGGQRQRVAIGRAIVREPAAFLFDEPLSNLDAALRVGMRLEISELHKRLKTTMIYVTHDQVEAMTLANRIVVMRAGRIEQVGRPLDLYNKPANLFVAGFIGAPRMNLIAATVKAASAAGVSVEGPGGLLLTVPVDGSALKPGDTVTLGIRPHDIALGDGDGHSTANVTLAEALGPETVVHATLASGETIVAVLSGQALAPGAETVNLALGAGRLHLFDAAGQRLPDLG